MVFEALLNIKKDDTELDNLSSILQQMQELIFSIDNHPTLLPKESKLSNSFLDSVKQAARLDLTVE